MKKCLFFLPAAVALTLLSGCLWSRVKVNDPTVADRARDVKPGVTRTAELEDILRARPSLHLPGKDTTLLGYTYSDTKNHGLMLVVVNFMRSTTVADTLYIETDPATQLVRKVHIPEKRNVDWRFWPFGD